ncbi:MAG: HAD-IIB family hydrolase [Chromatiales bacterium]|jgi:HAD superfamily hydrolase (TIGR01484 family)|nr:HAD-IIB family hydrolase [Chromatiales bacterium]
MNEPILLCTDLDRTLLPNGLQPESPEARPLFRAVTSHSEVVLAYASGRSQPLQQEVIQRYGLPMPHFAIADVGTAIYRLTSGRWEPWPEWTREMARGWPEARGADLARALGESPALRLQEANRQSDFKLSYYAPPTYDIAAFREWMDERLSAHGLSGMAIELAWSVDETQQLGLLDLTPPGATKLHALEFLITALGIKRTRCVYSGDSGNDLAVLESDIPSVLVRNAREDVRREALRRAAERGHSDALYLARGGLKGMNGNYAAGILEGMVRFLPETGRWL